MKDIGTVGDIANLPYTTATGNMSDGRIYEQVKKKFMVGVKFITSSKVMKKMISLHLNMLNL